MPRRLNGSSLLVDDMARLHGKNRLVRAQAARDRDKVCRRPTGHKMNSDILLSGLHLCQKQLACFARVVVGAVAGLLGGIGADQRFQQARVGALAVIV
ncbi:uncharacterized protein BDW70DRAFT_142850 [Aspergillus foveolatus]|uniref:uncharacterized protein n=1 Tax=Aspergillus foveolatus TaxID=210207 RepID=UPI003CCDCCB2